MYKRVLTAIAAAIIAAILLATLGPFGVNAVSSPSYHTIAHVQ